MKPNQIWSVEFGCYVSQTFMPRKEKNIKLDISNCTIKISEFGFYYLWLGTKKIKEISFLDFLNYKKFVKEVIEEATVYAYL